MRDLDLITFIRDASVSYREGYLNIYFCYQVTLSSTALLFYKFVTFVRVKFLRGREFSTLLLVSLLVIGYLITAV